MGFVNGSSCFRHQSLFSSSSSQCSLQPSSLLSSSKIAPPRMKNRVAMACMERKNSKDCDYCARRVVLFMGFAVIPLLKMRAEAIQENTELEAEDQKQDAEQSIEGRSSQNLFFPLLNALGFLGSGVLAALYASTAKEKATSDATIESMNVKLKDKESAINSLEKKFEAELLNEKENRDKALTKANDEHHSLVNQLKLANDTIKNLGRELHKLKKIVEDLTLQADNLEVSLNKAEIEKRELQEQLNEKLDSLSILQDRIDSFSLEIKDKEDIIRILDSKLAEKELEVNQLDDVYQQSQDEISGMKSEIERLKDLVLKNEEELELRDETVNSLHGELKSLSAEKDEYSNKLDAVLKAYNYFKSSTEEKSISDAMILGEREGKINDLEEKIEDSLDEVDKNRGLVSDLVREKDSLEKMLDKELKKRIKLEKELKISQDDLERSRNEASDLGDKLVSSRKSCLELEAGVSKIKSEYDETRESLKMNIVEAKNEVRVLAGEIKSAHELLCEKNKELQTKSEELSITQRKCDSLEKELIDAHTKAENAALDLKEEKYIISCLNKELNILETQISRNEETRIGLESDLGEATKSLNEMSQHVLMLSREMEIANGKISSLEDEREAILKAFDLQKQASQEARENLEDGHDLVMRLGKERESLSMRGKKLEQELASAKGEILRLTSEINSLKSRKVGPRKKVVEPGEED